MKTRSFRFGIVLIALATMSVYPGCEAVSRGTSSIPANYRGRPFSDARHASAPQAIPGRVECSLYDLGGEGVAYHDVDPINHGNGELNTNPRHQRPDASPEIWSFRANEGVDLSYVKDFADLNHDNLFTPEKNQLYIGWAADGEWCNYTVKVQAAGRYRITALYGSAANDLAFVVDEKRTFNAHFPTATGSMHRWNKAEIGTIEFEHPGLHLLTLRYNKGNNFAYFEFTPEEAAKPAASVNAKRSSCSAVLPGRRTDPCSVNVQKSVQPAMKRRKFLKLPLAASMFAAMARGAENKLPSPERSGNGFRVAARKNRQDEDLMIMGGRFDLKVSSRDSGGDLCIYDTVRWEKGGPALHRHHFQDEWFYVIRGEFVVQVGNDTLKLNPGDSAFAPRKVSHAFAKTSEGEGQMLVLFQPAGSMEDFFLQMSKLGKEIPQNQEVRLRRLWEEHGMEIVGPPLKV